MNSITNAATDRNANPEPLDGMNWEHPVGNASDPAFMEALFRHWYPHILKIARIRICFAQAEDATLAYDADDLAQDIALQAFSRFRHYNPLTYSFRNWISLAARSTTFDIRRKCKRRAALKAVKQMPDDKDGGDGMTALPDRTATDPAATAEARDFWGWGMAALEEKERRILILRFQHGLGATEIGRAEGFSDAAAGWYVNRGLGYIRSMIR